MIKDGIFSSVLNFEETIVVDLGRHIISPAVPDLLSVSRQLQRSGEWWYRKNKFLVSMTTADGNFVTEQLRTWIEKGLPKNLEYKFFFHRLLTGKTTDILLVFDIPCIPTLENARIDATGFLKATMRMGNYQHLRLRIYGTNFEWSFRLESFAVDFLLFLPTSAPVILNDAMHVYPTF